MRLRICNQFRCFVVSTLNPQKNRQNALIFGKNCFKSRKQAKYDYDFSR